MTHRGAAYQLWAAVEDERLRRGWTKTRLAEHIGKSRNTLLNLKDAPTPPLPETVHTIADAMGFDRVQAEEWAGLRPVARAEGGLSAREAVRRDPMYTDKQRQTMLSLMDIFEQANGSDDDREREAG